VFFYLTDSAPHLHYKDVLYTAVERISRSFSLESYEILNKSVFRMKSFLMLKVVIDLHVSTCIFSLKGQCRHHMEVRQFYRSAALILGTEPV